MNNEREDALWQEIKQRIARISEQANALPGIVMIHDVRDGSPLYLSTEGQRPLALTPEELKKGSAEHLKRLFGKTEASVPIVKVMERLREFKGDESISFFQQMSPAEQEAWYCCSMKVFMRDAKGHPLLGIMLSIPVDPDHQFPGKVGRLLSENMFLRRNYHRFDQLSEREKEVLKYLALGKTSGEIAGNLNIAVATVDTHRRNIKLKLETRNSFELAEYARVFDLI